MYEKSVTIFYTLQYFSIQGGSSVPKFISLGDDLYIRQGPVYQSAKFRPRLTTRLVYEIFCCQTSVISLKA